MCFSTRCVPTGADLTMGSQCAPPAHPSASTVTLLRMAALTAGVLTDT